MRQRGGLYYAHLPGVAERKIVLVVSWNAVNSAMHPIIARVTSRSRERNLPTFVPLDAGEANLRQDSYVLCHELTMLPESVIDEEPIGTLSLGRMLDVSSALKRALDIP